MVTKADMTSILASCSVSSVLNRDVKQFGKKHLFDEDLESCWSSEAGSPQWIQLTLKEPTALVRLAIQFQGGFAGRDCSLESDGNDVFKFYPEDDNSLQKIDLPRDFLANTVHLFPPGSVNWAKGSSMESHSGNEETSQAGRSTELLRTGEPPKKILVTGSSGNTLLVNPKQKGNALLKHITGVIWEYDGNIVPDYVLGRTSCALFLSLAYHNLKPDYINQRIKQLGKLYDLRVLLVQVDMPDPHFCLKHLTRVCLLTDLTLMLAWSPEEAAKILQTYKSFEHKPPDLIMEKTESDTRIKLVSALTSIRSINKTDASTLLDNYGSLEMIVKATPHSLALCPGLGQQKAQRLHSALRTPFLKSDGKSKPGIAKYFNN